MNRLERLKRNPRLLAFAKLGAETKAINGVAALFYLHRGVRIDQVFYLSIAWSVSSLIFEVPTGYLADRFGRKRTLLLGTVISFCSFLLAIWAHGFWIFCLQFALMSFGFSCFSGTEEALLFDTLKETKEEHRMTHHFARLNSARQVMKVFIPTIGAILAKDLLDWQFQALLAVDAFGMFISFLILSRLEEPKHVKEVLAYEEGIFKQSLRTIRSEPFLLRAALNKIFIFIVSFLIWRIYQPYFVSHGISTVWLAVFYALLQGGMTIFFFFTDRIEKRIHPVRLVFWTTILIMAGLIGSIFFQTPLLLMMSCGFALFMSGIRAPMLSHAINLRIHSRSRATTLSNLYVMNALVDIPLLFVSGILALHDLRYVFVLAISLCLMVLIFFPIRHKDFIPTPSDVV